MRNIYYDVEGDILSVTFVEVEDQHTGIELSDNIVLYFNPDTEQPIKLLLLSYRLAWWKPAAKPRYPWMVWIAFLKLYATPCCGWLSGNRWPVSCK